MAETQKRKRKWWKVAAIAGIVLGAACHALPPKYQEPCRAASKVISIASGGSVAEVCTVGDK